MLLTIIFALLAGIILARIFADVLKAAVLVALVVGAIYLCRGVSFEALVDDGARELYDAAGAHDRPLVHRTVGRRI
jgi:uncharacterized membrane protein